MEDKITVLQTEQIWHQLYDLALKILESKFLPDVIIGISRGGLPVARFLSDLLEVKEITTIGVGFYKGINETEKKPSLTQKLNYDIKEKKVLLVDDVSDSGKSMKFTLKYLSNFQASSIKTATIHYKPHSIYKPDYYIVETSDWIVYPWEYVEFSRLYYKNNIQTKNENIINQDLADLLIPKEVISILKHDKKIR